MKNGRNNKKSRRKKIYYYVSSIVIIILALFIGLYIYINNTFNKVEEVKVNIENIGLDPEVKEETKEETKEIRNIALLGVDSSDEGVVGRSDSIIILTLDNVHNKIKLTSIMRDSYVNIDGYGMDKINHAYAYGGAELALKTLNENFDLNISEVVIVNFNSLIGIIDKLGGVNINITQEELPHVPGIRSSGDNILNGTQALAYSRIRYATGGDYKRTERQRTVINAIFNNMKNTPVTKYPELIDEFLPYIQTNISTGDLLSLGAKFSGLAKGDISQDRFPRDGQCEGKIINGIYYLTFDIDSVKNSMKDYIFNDK